MNRELFLVRHAQANEKAIDQKDIDRVLSTDGMQQSTRVGFYLKNKNIIPDMIITSPAIRAQQTATIIAEQLKLTDDQIHANEELYDASVRTFLQVINFFKEDWTKVLVVGHNPTISYLAEYITNYELGSMETSSFASITVPKKSWSVISEGTCDLLEYVSVDEMKM